MEIDRLRPAGDGTIGGSTESRTGINDTGWGVGAIMPGNEMGIRLPCVGADDTNGTDEMLIAGGSTPRENGVRTA